MNAYRVLRWERNGQNKLKSGPGTKCCNKSPSKRV